jgi:PPOX class probable F420-dependent enzyme
MSISPERAGHGINQRALIKMTPAEVDDYLRAGKTMVMCTINHDGSIHAVAMYYGFLDGCVAFETKTKSQKVKNLRRNPTITCLLESGDRYEELKGVSLIGRGEVIEDRDRMFELGISVWERNTGPYTPAADTHIATMLNKRVAVKVHVDRVVSWDHSKLNLKPT